MAEHCVVLDPTLEVEAAMGGRAPRVAAVK